MSFMWFLTWTPYALSHRLNPLLTNWIFSDSGANLAWNTAVPFVGLVVSPLTWALGPIFSYNAAMILGMAASAWSAYYAALRLFRCRPYAAVLAGAVYGFSPFMTAHAVGHPHLVIAFTPPLFLLVLYDIFVTQQHAPWLNGMKLAFLTLIQYFINSEGLLMSVFLAAVGTCLLLISRRRALSRGQVVYGTESLLVAGIIALLVLSYPLYLAFFGPWQPYHPIHESADIYVADSLSFILPTSVQALSTVSTHILTSFFSGNLGEWNTYLGLPLIMLLGIIAYIKRADGNVRFLSAILLATVIFSLGPSLHVAGHSLSAIPLPWRLVERVPFLRDVLTTRFGQYIYLFAGLILAIYVSDDSVSQARRLARLAASLAVVVFLLPTVPLPYPVTHAEVPEFFRLPRAQQHIESPALIVPFSTEDRATAMLWQAEAGLTFKMPEGYAFGQGRGPWPAPTPLSDALIDIEDTGHAPAVTSAFRAQIIGVLKRQRIRTILLGPSPHEHDALRFLVEVLGWTPDSVDGVFIWRRIDRRL
ncbi:MAG TPA: hypothetical protein VGZ23_14910 [bacterium]|nr:hypothetical protein [bacterium]